MQLRKKPKPLSCTRIIWDAGPLMVFLCSYEGTRGFDPEVARRICSNSKDADFYKWHGEDLLKIVGKKEVLITPHVVTEVSNRVKASGFDLRKLLDKGNYIINLLLTKGNEQHLSLKELFDDRIFNGHKDLGVTDCALMILTEKTDLLWTDDKKLKKRANQEGISAMLSKDIIYSVRDYQQT